MTRGRREDQLTKAQLLQLLVERFPTFNPPQNVSSSTLVGHAIHYGLLTLEQIRETVPRVETTIACYLKSVLPTLPGIADKFEAYTTTASRLYNRGSYILNLVTMKLYGDRMPIGTGPDLLPTSIEEGFGRLGREVVRYDRESALYAAEDFLQFVGRDVRNSPFKQAFLPERWPTATIPLHETVSDVVQNETHLPPVPPEWKSVMSSTGWDNVINRMATKALGNFKVHCCAGLAKRTRSWLGSGEFFVEPYPPYIVQALQDMLSRRPRPLVVHQADFEMVSDLRTVLGVRANDVTWYLPDTPEYCDETVALHLFLTRYGPDDRSYLPVARRSRKYCYVDHKVFSSMASTLKKRSRSTGSNNNSGGCGRRRRGAATRVDTRVDTHLEEEQEVEESSAPPPPAATESDSLGSIMGLTPESFNAKRKQLRGELRKKLSARKRDRPNSASAKRIKKKRNRLGCGMMNRDAVVQSMETDGVGARMCVKTPIDVREHVKPIAEEQLKKGGDTTTTTGAETSAAAKRRRRQPKKKKQDETVVDEGVLRDRLHVQPPPIMLGMDSGRKKLFVGALSQYGCKKPTTVTFTRARYYSEMHYWRHRGWSVAQTKKPGVSEALVDVSRAGGFRCCDEETWRRSMEAERRHHDVLDREFVANPEYAVWKMRLHRLKRASLDRNANRTIRAATHGQSPNRLLLMGIGKASFPSSGRGELSAPTHAVVEALRRQAKKETLRTGRRIQFEDVEEFRTTVCCSSCGSVTTKPRVRSLDRGGDRVERMSRRLRLCTTCERETGGKRRDRDVQGARNMLWILQHEYYGGGVCNRPWYLTRTGCISTAS